MKKSILTATAMTAGLLSATAQGHYKEYGSAEKPAIRIIHGFPGNATDWEATAKGLSAHYRVIVPDLIGFGNNAVNLGSDTDTAGAVTGGLAGLLYGFDSIHANWIAQLARKNDIENLVKRLSDKIVSQ